MKILYDSVCAEYAAPGHPEAPFRVLRTSEALRERHPAWFGAEGAAITLADDRALERAHSRAYLERLASTREGMFDPDTAALPGMDEHARRAAGAGIATAEGAWRGDSVFSLFRPPGHHATREQIMGFCYVNSIAVAARHAREALRIGRVAVWDFDAHHGNGTEDILRGQPGTFYASVHQYPGYPGTGTESRENVRNDPVAPGTPAPAHLAALESNWAALLAFRPELILVSAGFDSFAGDPLTDLRLRPRDFAVLGQWCREAPCPVGAILEGGYSQELPLLINTFVEAWEGE